MEPKSIAFYTAVAVSILAVLSATTFPTLAQAQQADDEEEELQAQADNEAVTDETDPEEENEAVTDNTEPEEEKKSNSANSNDNGAASQSLGLSPSSGVASCGQIVTEDVTLTSDLDCGPGDGLTVGASDIT